MLANRDLLVLGEEERTAAAVVVPAAGDGKVAALTGDATSVSVFSFVADIVTDVIHGGMRLLYKMNRRKGKQGRKEGQVKESKFNQPTCQRNTALHKLFGTALRASQIHGYHEEAQQGCASRSRVALAVARAELKATCKLNYTTSYTTTRL